MRDRIRNLSVSSCNFWLIPGVIPRSGSIWIVIEKKDVINIRMQGFCHIMCKPEGGIVLPLFKKDNRLPPYPHGFCKILLRHRESYAEFFDFCLHTYPVPGMLLYISLTEEVHLEEHRGECEDKD